MNISHFYKKIVSEFASAGSPSPELDANVLIENVIGKDRTFLFSHPLEPLTNAQYYKLRRFVNRRKKGEPIAYITGHKEFYGLDFAVNKNVLIPRPETEFLVAKALEFLKRKSDELKNRKINILDIGTGSGCIIISIIKSFSALAFPPYARFFAADISRKALIIAKKNTKRLLFDVGDQNLSSSYRSNNKIKFIDSDLFSNRLLRKKPASPAGGFDIIIANLPYVPDQTENRRLKFENIYFEPPSAIFAPDNGARTIKRFIDQSKSYINKNSLILIELDPRNAVGLEKYARKTYREAKIELKKDLAGLDRYLIIEN